MSDTAAVSWPHSDFPETVDLPQLGHLPPLQHLFEARDVWAIKAALGARRPLLVRGEPGTGKSQLARAAAIALQRPFVSHVINSRTEPTDLLYRFDAVARLGQAQVLSASRVAPTSSLATPPEGSASGPLRALAELLFVEPGPLWWVFNWVSAEAQYGRASVKGARPHAPEAWTASQGAVLLLDEIDKADSDLPNSLLESLGNGEFHVPYLDEPVSCSGASEPPLVVITTNEERELPEAFVRRCLVLELTLPTGAELERRLVQLAQQHFPSTDKKAQELYAKAAEQLRLDREQLGPDQLAKPGQAEYLDLLRATLDIARRRNVDPLTVLGQVQNFALRKNPGSVR